MMRDRGISEEEKSRREEVIIFSNLHGVKAASEKFSVSSPKIWDWRAKAKARQAQTLKSQRLNFVEVGEARETDEAFNKSEAETKMSETETEAVDVGWNKEEKDFKYNPINMTDMMHVDSQLLSKTEENFLVKIKNEAIVEFKIELAGPPP